MIRGRHKQYQGTPTATKPCMGVGFAAAAVGGIRDRAMKARRMRSTLRMYRCFT